ncbi:MAG: PA0069 family radical SAM protein [Gammaproteobacteria bacterium]|nr:PA0069 family radical SAM protein [Gammaproteobacteria bacterium]
MTGAVGDGWRKGRGALGNPAPRYLPVERQIADDGWGGQAPGPGPRLRTTVTLESPRSIVSRNRSPDVPFDRSINPYRGCEHGCIYCYARPTHAYLDLSPGLDFETRLFAKPAAAELLRRELSRNGYRCRPIALGTNTDPYQPIERRFQVTRQIIEVLADCGHPLLITTKSSLVERDLDLLAPMAARGLVKVSLSLTTLDHDLARRLEPRATAPRRRLQTLERLAAAGIPAGVMFAPVIPAVNDRELEEVLRQAAAVGCRFAGYVVLRLPREVRGLFRQWLRSHRPRAEGRVFQLIRELRQGRENDPRFGTRMKGSGAFALLIAQRFRLCCSRLGLNRAPLALDTGRFRPPSAPPARQLSLF